MAGLTGDGTYFHSGSLMERNNGTAIQNEKWHLLKRDWSLLIFKGGVPKIQQL